MHAVDLTPIALILSLAFVSAFIFRRLGQPLLVGYIIVGVVVAPFLVHSPGAEQSIPVFAELGVLLLMFMLGLELDLARFKKLFKPAMLVVLLQVIAGLIVMGLVSLVIELDFASTVLLGFIISLSSTAVAMGTLRDLRQENTSAGLATTAILIAQDLAVIPMLLVVSVLSNKSLSMWSFLETAVALFVVVLTMAIIFFISESPRLLRSISNFLDRAIEQPVIAGIAFCFVAAALSGVLGLSTAYGAFAAGLLLGNLGDISDRLEQSVKPIYDLLIMIFFLSVGLIIDIGYVIANLWQVVTLVAVVLVLKTVINIAIIRLLKLSDRGSSIAGASLAQIGEFSFVLAGLGLSSAILSQDTYQLALVTIAVSLIFSPLWVRIVQHHFGIESLQKYIRAHDKLGSQKNKIKERLGINQ